MYEEERHFSWTNLFIKVIAVTIIILFILWLLSLPNKKVSNKLDILTDSIFSENVEKLKTAGKDYFTTDRLPKKVGEVEKITLEKMYNDKLLLTLKNKKGEACSAEKSYVSVEKTEKLYKMRVYLDCGEDKDYIILSYESSSNCTINTCDKDTTTDNKNNNISNNTTNNNNTNSNAGNGSNSNKPSNTGDNTGKTNDDSSKNTEAPYVTTINDYRCNKQTHSWTFIESCQSSSVSGAKCKVAGGKNVLLANLTNGAQCPSGNSNSNSENSNETEEHVEAAYVTAINDYRCNKKTGTWIFIKSCQLPSVSNAKCSVSNGSNVLMSNLTNGAHCSTSKPGSSTNSNTDNSSSSNTSVIKYEYVKVTDGYWSDWSDYSKWSTTKVTANDYRQVETKTVKEPYTYYSTTITDKEAGTPYCPTSKSGYIKVSEENEICKYAKYVEIPKEVDPICDDTNIKVKDLVFVRRNVFTCVYRSKNKVTSTNKYTLSKKAISSGSGWSVPANTNKYAYKTEKTTWMPKCSNGKCITTPFYVYSKYEKIYEKNYQYTNIGATCPKDAKFDANSTCVIKEKTIVDTYEKSKVCPSGQNKINGKCYTQVTSSTKNTGYKDVTYYRYRTREYKKGTTYYEWSTSKNDTKLLNLGYKLTGKTDN